MADYKKNLILSRNVGECFTIFVGDEEINVCLHQVDRKQCKIRINANDNVKIYRDELLEQNDKPKTNKNDLVKENEQLKQKISMLEENLKRANRYRRGYFLN